jgi:hypothetical protein
MGNLVLAGSSSGSTTISPTDAVTVTLTLPSTTGTLATTANGTVNSGTQYQLGYYATTGTAISGSSSIKTDASGNLGLGVTPSAWSAHKVLQVGAYASFGSFNGNLNSQVMNNAYWDGSAYRYIGSTNAAYYAQTNGVHNWYSAPSGTAGNAITFTQEMTLFTSGSLGIGTTIDGSLPLSGCWIAPNYDATSVSGIAIGHPNGSDSSTTYMGFVYNSTKIGSITQNGTTGVLYNLTSDYRLKNNPVALTGFKDFVMALQPKTWDWYDNSGKGVGFIAHEFMEVAKYSGHGEKDAVETVEIKDEEGNVTGTEQRPIYQSIQPSSSEVMANLVAFIQELNTLITAQSATITSLTERITALEGART